MQTPALPFKIIALAPFRRHEESFWKHKPIQVDKTNPDQAVESLGLSFYIPIPNNLCQAGSLTISLKRLKDLHPDSIIENNSFLKNLLEAKRFVEEARAKGLSDEEMYERLKRWPDIPIEINFERQKTQESSSSPIDEILQMVSMPEKVSISSGETQPFIVQIDSILQQILSRIFLYEDFRNLESVWQGLKFLIKQEGINGEINMEIVPVSLETLEDTLDHLTPVLIENTPSLIIIDLPFDNSPRSLELLEKVTLFSETLMVPAICWITNRFLYLDTWNDMKKLPFLPHYLEEPAFAKWRHLRGTSSGRWVAVVCNRFLVRYPYGPDNKPGLVFFNEPQGLWVSPVWAMASLICQSFLKTGWPTRFTDWQNIRLGDLPLHLKEGSKYLATEAFFSEERIDQFIRSGMTPLVSTYNKDMAFIPYETTIASSSLRYQLFLSRITQLLFWCKDNIEKDLAPAEIESSIKKAFSLFWEKTGYFSSEDIEISVRKLRPEQPAIVRIVIKASRQILPTGEKIELEVKW